MTDQTGVLRAVLRDIEANLQRPLSPVTVLGGLIWSRGVQAALLYRWAHWCAERRLVPLAEILVRISQLVHRVDIHYGARIGPGLALRHATGVVIGSQVVIGSDAVLYQHVTIGKRLSKRSSRPDGMAVVGDGVTIGAGAVLLGPISIGDGAVVGANCVVAEDVQPGATVTAPRPVFRPAE